MFLIIANGFVYEKLRINKRKLFGLVLTFKIQKPL